MKCIQINISISNEEKFRCRVEINNLAREDANAYESMMAEQIQEVVEKYVDTLTELMKQKHDNTTLTKNKI